MHLLAQSGSRLTNPVQRSTFIKPGESPESVMRSNMFVSVITNKKTVFIGEPLLVIYKFYTALPSQSSVMKQPQFEGCSVQELAYELEPNYEVLNGKNYKVFIIRKVQLTPLEEGSLDLGQAVVENVVEFVNEKNEFKPSEYSILLSNKRQVISVNSLPQMNVPETFNGITGDFKLEARVTERNLPVNENGHLIITIKGEGNLQGINQPEIQWPASIEHFSPTDSQHINLTEFPISGDRVFDFIYLGKEEGSTVLPPVSLTYFNTATYRYLTIYSDSIPVKFTKAVPVGKMLTLHTNTYSHENYVWSISSIAFACGLILFALYVRNKKRKEKKARLIYKAKAATIETDLKPAAVPKEKTDLVQAIDQMQYLIPEKSFFSEAKHILTLAIQQQAENYVELPHQQEALQIEIGLFYQQCDIAIYSPFHHQQNFQEITYELKQLVARIEAGQERNKLA